MEDISNPPAGVREVSGNVHNQQFNTLTGAFWKGDSVLATKESDKQEPNSGQPPKIAGALNSSRIEGVPGTSENRLFEAPHPHFSLGQDPVDTEAELPTMNGGYFNEVSNTQHVVLTPQTTTASGHHNVHFAESTGEAMNQDQTMEPNVSQATPSSDRPHYLRNTSLMSKILALSPSTTARYNPQSPSIPQGDEEHTAPSPMSRLRGRSDRLFRARTFGAEHELDTDADGEDDDNAAAAETSQPSHRPRRKRPMLRGRASDSPAGLPDDRRSPIRRRTNLSTRPTTLTEERQGVSEDEGRERLTRATMWRRRSTGWLHRESEQSGQSPHVGSDNTRGNNKRFFNGLASPPTGQDGIPGPRRMRPERRVQAQEAWQKIRNSMKMIVQKTKAEEIDQTKSAELVAELLAGSPAALILASHFQRDERDKKRIPVLLEQLKISIPSCAAIKDDGSVDRHLSFHIELEYGSGLMRMKWTIERTLRDFYNLHLKYKLQNSTQKYKPRKSLGEEPRTKLPKFPRSAFPILRTMQALQDEDDEEDTAEEGDNLDGTTNGGGLSRQKTRTNSFRMPARALSSADTRRSKVLSFPNGAPPTSLANVVDVRKENLQTRQRRQLEQYLQKLIRFVIFRAGNNRLCRFLELSALGVRLASEGSYHGKEGTLVLQTSKGIDFRKAFRPGLLLERHKPMWFLVRHSYLVCVDSPEEMNIYDVFLVDNGFQLRARRPRLRDQKTVQDWTKTAGHQARHPQFHTLRLQNNERKIRLIARNDRQLQQFEDSLRLIKDTSDWAGQNRFDSFAPLRRNVFAQWLVDGRDYMWNVSRAISMAQDVIYIHDWWLSPEIYMRRPAAISQKWRLDRLLQRKAEEGVKIFVIVYRNINSAIPIDSEYTKFSLLDLHPNVFVQRSPNQLRQNTFFWAHHEKLCIVDHVIAFCGGIDLCFGRWDTPQHSVLDDKPTGFEPTNQPLDADHCQLFPGKDYSNPRVLDFFKLDEPYGEMYDRTKVPRMPWHDISMQIVGQPARDLSRHFVQRWNYILRQRKPSRPTPFLLPPPNFAPNELETLGLDGTCEVQMLRSACDWSIGTPHKVERSILNAYCKLIQASEHFVYIENQFFITSCTVEGTKIRNGIGDALVERIVRAHAAGEKWRAIIVIPLMPGFQNTVDAQDGSSIRLIMQCQYRSIDRGEFSIFERLRSAGVAPEDYVDFYSLRAWGKIGPTKAIVTEQLYIHAKCMVVDDRYTIIGSANINERSMLGERDSEIAAIISDTDMLDSTMGGIPFKVSRFSHTLRMRLMREHLGIDVDAIMDEEREHQVRHDGMDDLEERRAGRVPSDADRVVERKLMQSKHQQQDDLIARYEEMHTFNHDVDWEQANNPHLLAHKKVTTDPRVTGNADHKADVDGYGFDKMAIHKASSTAQGRDTVILNHDREVLVNDTSPESKGTVTLPVSRIPAEDGALSSSHSSVTEDSSTLTPAEPIASQISAPASDDVGLISQLPPLPATDDSDIGGPPLLRRLTEASAEAFSPLLASIRRPVVTKDCMKDPIADNFFHDVWHTVAANNTKLFRQVFRCMPDSQVTNWRDYESAVAYADRFAQSQGVSKSTTKMQQESHGATGPPGHGVSILSQPLAAAKAMLTTDGAGIDRTDELERMRSATASSGGDKSMSGGVTSVNSQPAHEEADTLRDQSLNEKSSEKFPEPKTKPSIYFSPKVEAEVMNEKQPAEDSEPVLVEQTQATNKRRKRTTTKSSGGPMYGPNYMPSKEDAEELLNLVQGSLIEWPYNWLAQEEKGGKWLYSVDQISPLEIYN